MNLLPPRRSGAAKSAEVVGSYASVLKGLVRPLATGTETKYDSTTLRPRKRLTVSVANNKEDTTQSQHTWHKRPSTSQSQQDNNLHEVERRMEEKLSQELNALKIQMDKISAPSQTQATSPVNLEQRFATLREELESKLEEKINNITNQLQQYIMENITTSFTKLTEVFETKLERTMTSMLDNITSKLSGTPTSSTNTNSDEVMFMHTQKSDASYFQTGSDVDMIGARDP